MRAHSDSVDAKLDNWIIIPSWLGHVSKVENVFLIYLELFKEVSHTKLFVHARSGNIDRGGTADFVEKIGEFGATFFDDGLAFLGIGIPSIFGFSASFLAEGGKSDLREAIFDDFVAVGELIGFPVAEFAGRFFESCCNLYNIFIFERVIVNLLPVAVSILIILRALRDKEMEMSELSVSDTGGFERVDNLDDELIEFLPRNGANLEIIKAFY